MTWYKMRYLWPGELQAFAKPCLMYPRTNFIPLEFDGVKYASFVEAAGFLETAEIVRLQASTDTYIQRLLLCWQRLYDPAILGLVSDRAIILRYDSRHRTDAAEGVLAEIVRAKDQEISVANGRARELREINERLQIALSAFQTERSMPRLSIVSRPPSPAKIYISSGTETDPIPPLLILDHGTETVGVQLRDESTEMSPPPSRSSASTQCFRPGLVDAWTGSEVEPRNCKDAGTDPLPSELLNSTVQTSWETATANTQAQIVSENVATQINPEKGFEAETQTVTPIPPKVLADVDSQTDPLPIPLTPPLPLTPQRSRKSSRSPRRPTTSVPKRLALLGI